MKFSCEKYLLNQAIGIASRCAASKSPIPSLEGLLIQAGGETVTITGYDLKKGIYTSFPADVAVPGSIVLNCKLFGEIVRSLPDDIVTVDVESGFNTKITGGDSEFAIIGSDSDEYPELPVVDKQDSVTVPQNILGKMIRQTVFAVSDNESRPIYTGSFFEVKKDLLTVVAVDGYRLALRREEVEACSVGDCSFIVPGAAVSDVEKLCADSEDPVDITVGAKHISFVIGSTVLVSRRLEGEFLNYEKSIPTDFGTVIEVNTSDLVKSVSRVSLVIDEKVKNPLRVNIEDSALMISCRTGVGNAEDRCGCDVSGPSGLVIGLNNRFLLDALKAVPAETVKIGFNTSSSPCVLFPADGSDIFSYMILPIRIRVE